MGKKLFGNRIAVTVWTVLLTSLIGWGIDYLALVPINFSSSGFWWFAVGITVFATVIAIIFNAIYKFIEDGYDYYETVWGFLFKGNTVPAILGCIGIVLIIAMFITSISGWKMGHSDQYANIVTVEEGNFAEEVPNVTDNQNIVYVDQKTAQKLGDRTLGGVKNSSWYEVDDEYNLVCIN